MWGEEWAGQWGGGYGGEVVAGGGHGSALHSGRVSDKEDLGFRVLGFELIGNSHRRVDVAAGAAGGENDSEIAGDISI